MGPRGLARVALHVRGMGPPHAQRGGLRGARRGYPRGYPRTSSEAGAKRACARARGAHVVTPGEKATGPVSACKLRCLLAIEREPRQRGERFYYAATRGVLCATCDELARDTLTTLGKPHACLRCGHVHGDECPKRSSAPPRRSSAPPPPGEVETLDALDVYLKGLNGKRAPTTGPEVVRGFDPKTRRRT